MTIQQEYTSLLLSGVFWVIFPTYTGTWSVDKKEFTEFVKQRELKLAQKN